MNQIYTYPGFGSSGGTTVQDYAGYTEAEQGRWRTLFAQQAKLAETHATPEHLAGLDVLDTCERIPDIARTSERLEARTGWTLMPVTGLVSNDDFNAMLSSRVFPVTCRMRSAEEMDFYVAEPDIFHDCFGHVPMLCHKPYGDFLASFARQGALARSDGEAAMMARLFWYTVDFGLIDTPRGLRILGGGLLSSPGETDYCLNDPRPLRVGLAPERMVQTDFYVGHLQKIYFVAHSFADLTAMTAGDFMPLYSRYAGCIPLPPGQALPEDELFEPRGY
ncbi:MAG: phenylalanine 4-monooxygenase [Alphaproteobacteria bacterium]|nr:phenylalanine 4-monooxygenase [Alphaproteobacteria bacterium]